MISTAHRLTATAILVGTAVFGAALQSQATPPTDRFPPGVTIARIENGKALDAFAARLEAVRSPDATGRVPMPGFVNLVMDVDNKAIRITWHQLSTNSRVQLDELARSAGVNLTYVDSPYSLDDIDSATKKLLASSDSLKSQGITIEKISPTPPNETLPSVSVVAPDRPGRTLETVTEDLERIAGIPLKVSVTQTSTIINFGRQDDNPNFAAGGLFKFSTTTGGGQLATGRCTNGFAVKSGTSNYILTARHCIAPFDDVFTSNLGSASYGHTAWVDSATAVKALTGSGASSSFTGWYGSSTYLSVTGYAKLYSGQFMCTSGANTGEHCGLKVFESSTTLYDGYGYYTGGTARSTSSSIAAGQGDSGGPTYAYASSNTLTAVGVIQGGSLSFQTPCPATQVPADVCSTDVLFTQIADTFASRPGLTLK